MRLVDKMSQIESSNTVSEIGKICDQAHVAISAWGQRVIFCDGYKGSVTIDQLAQKYLNAAPFNVKNNSSLKDRLDCLHLWDRVEKLYGKSDAKLRKTCRLCSYALSVREYLRDKGDTETKGMNESELYSYFLQRNPRVIIDDRTVGRECLYQFTPEAFRQHWPHSKPYATSEKGLLFATQPMMESADQKKRT